MDATEAPVSEPSDNIFENFVKDLNGSLKENCAKKIRKSSTKRKIKKDEKKYVKEHEIQKLNLSKKITRNLIAVEQQELPAFTAAIIRTDW